jgi:O-antigen/teichoic acid export membrane protein
MAETGKSFIKKFVGFSMVTWISFAIGFLTAPFATRLFAPDVVGKINIFNTYSNLFGIFILIGLDQAFARFYLERPNNKSVGYLFSFCFGITYSILAVTIIASIPFDSFISLHLFEENDNFLLYLFFISVFCTSTLRYLNLSYRMEKNIKMYTIQGVLMTLVSKCFYLAVGFWEPSYKPALFVLTVTHLILAVIFLVIQRKRFVVINKVDKVFAKEMFKYALPLTPVTVLMWANTSIPQVVMQKTMDYTSIGLFTSAAALAGLISLIQAGFNTFWLPYTYENYKTQTGQFEKLHRYLMCMLAIFAILLILSQDVVFLLLGEKYRSAKIFFPYLILGPVCYIISETTGLGIDISKKTYYNILVFSSSVLVNILLCLLLQIPLGLTGIAIATAVASIVSMVIKTVVGQKYYRAIEHYRYMIATIIIVIIGGLITQLMYDVIGVKIVMLLILLLFALLFFKTEIVELKEYAVSIINDYKKKK